MFTRRLRRWARRRQGTDRGAVELHPRRIYLLPTRAGMVFAALLLTMLVGALNYSNNMGFALAFLLAALAVTGLYDCQRNLVGLRVTVSGGLPVFAGEPLQIRVHVHNPSTRMRRDVLAGADDGRVRALDVPPGGTVSFCLRLPTARRGPVEAPPLRLGSAWPFGLFRAWAWLHPEMELIAWPAPAPRAPRPPEQVGASGDGSGDDAPGIDDFAGLRSSAPGEPPSRIAWKAFARSGELLARELRGGRPAAWLDWYAMPATDPETRLSLLSRLVVEADAGGSLWGLRLPGIELPPAAGPAHKAECLRRLALFGHRATGSGT